MKIAMLAARLPPANDGVGDHAHMLAVTLRARGNDVTIIDTREPSDSASAVMREGGSRWGLAATFRAIASLRTLHPQALLVEYTPFLYGPHSFAPFALLLAASLWRIRRVIIVHEAFYEASMPAVNSAWKAALFGFRDAVTIRVADVIATASFAKSTSIVKRLPAVARRIVVVPIGSNIEPGPGYRHQPHGDAVVVCFGVVMPRRRLEFAIGAVASLVAEGNDVRLKIIGRTHDRKYANDLKNLALQMGVVDRVEFCGEYEPAEISQALSGASAAVHAAVEGTIASSGSLLALLSHGVPTVAVRTQFDDRIFSNAVDFVKDQNELAQALGVLISQSSSALRLSSAARLCYQANFAWSTAADRLGRAIASVPI